MAAFPTSDETPYAHLIDDDGHLLPSKEIQDYLLSALSAPEGGEVLHNVGINYHVVGVLGGQSSGKSTLLNWLFSTNFQTMDETKRRGQTTKGAFIARASPKASARSSETAAASTDTASEPSSPLFVVDFEGTDGFERGENQSFERQLSLFALCVADTLIINMWAVDVGRFNAANMSLLRTIFEVNLQLFSHDSYKKEEKPTLLIVLRDFTGDETEFYFKTVRQSFDKIWDNIVKPEAFQNTTIDVLFDLRYHVLPHFKLQRSAFEDAVAKFREMFFVPTNQKYLFHGRGMFRNVPLDGISSYLSSCWEMICASKDLDIPTQRELLAKHRCLEVKNNISLQFTESCRKYTERLQQGELVPHVSDVLEREIDEHLRVFHTQTRLYKADIVERTKKELDDDLLQKELKVVGDYAKHLASKALEQMDTPVSDVIDRRLRWMLSEAQLIPLISSNNGEAEQRRDYMHNENNGLGGAPFNEVLLTDNEKCNALVRDFWTGLCQSLQEDIDLLQCNSDQQQSSSFHDRYASLMAEDPALQEAVIQAVFDTIFQKVSHRFASMAENAAGTIHQAFENALSRNMDGTIRFFKTTTALLRTEPQAQQAGLVLLNCLMYYRMKVITENAVAGQEEKSKQLSRIARHLLSEHRGLKVRDNSAEQKFFLHYRSITETPRYPTGVLIADTESSDKLGVAVDRSCVLLNQQSVQRVFDVYKQKCEFTMQNLLRTIESNKQRLPAWVLPAMLILGWNELLYVLTSPILLSITIVLGALFLKDTLASQWAVFQETGPPWAVMGIRMVLQYAQEIYNNIMPPGQNEVVRNAPRYRDPNALSGENVPPTRTSAPSNTVTDYNTFPSSTGSPGKERVNAASM